MAWNEPGGGNGNDPWSGRGGGQKGPPDLDELIRNLQQRFGALFGGRGGGGAAKGGGISLVVILVIGAILWLLSGIYIVDEGWRGVVLRFGKYLETTEPGPHWHIPYPIERVEKVDVERRRAKEIGYRASARAGGLVSVPREALMLTEDENIVDIRLSIQYQVKHAKNYLFQVLEPDESLQQVAETAIREVVGKSKMDFVLKEGRAEVASLTKTLMQSILDQYQTGLHVTNVNLQDAQPPEEVQAAFEDAIKAREDEERQKNEAEAYSNDVIPKARGSAARQLEEAQAYKEQVIAQADGESRRFTDLLREYRKAPEVTRERLYIDAVESVLANSSKIMIDVQGGGNLLYLPLDKLMQSGGAIGAVRQQGSDSSGLSLPNGSGASAPTAARPDLRDRRAR